MFRKGKLGGLITIQNNRRELPFQNLASRTIGKSRPGLKPIGLEGAFDSVLMGVSGTRLMQKLQVMFGAQSITKMKLNQKMVVICIQQLILIYKTLQNTL